MAKLQIAAGATSQSVNIFIQANNVTTGAGLTALVFNSANLIAYYTFVGTNTAATAITLATLAAANSAYSSGGFKEIDATNMPGMYRLDIPNAALASAKGRSCVIMLSGATNMAPCVLEIELTAVDNQSTGFGLVNASANVAQWNGTNVSAPATAGIPDVNVKNIDNDAASASGTVTFPNATLASTTNITAGTITTVTTVTNQLTAAAIATGVWQDATAGDFTTASSIGKALYVSNVAPGGSGGHMISGSNAGTTTLAALTVTGNFSINGTNDVAQTGDSFARIGVAGVGLTNLGDTRIANLDATVSSRMATYTQPTGFLAATFPTGTVANTTNITAGTITTVTNLTNAPTAGDFTATMKTSLNSATPVATLSSAYDFAKGTVAMTESYAAVNATLTPAQALYGINQFLGQHSTSGATWTVKKRDGSTIAKTYTLDSATAPTSLTEAT